MKRQVKKLIHYAGRMVQSESLSLQNAINKELQILLSMQYRASDRRPSLRDAGFNLYSATDEDGILLYIFSLIGMRSRICVDIGAANIVGSNTPNLILNHGFTGLLIDGSESGMQNVREFYAQHPATAHMPPKAVTSLVTAENINDVITSNGVQGEIDLLGIDIDGNDYWIWEAITCVDPAVVLIEYQDILGPDRAWTIPYKPDFNGDAYEVNREQHNYNGASLRALARLGKRKGYRLVGTHRYGWNAFFVKNGRGEDVLPEVTVESCFDSPWNRYGMEHRFPLVANMEWVEIA